MSLPIPDNKKKKPIPSFDEVMKEQYTPPKIPSYDEVMSESPKKKLVAKAYRVANQVVQHLRLKKNYQQYF